MRVLVTGPESSGTRWLTEFLRAAGADALHRSQPEGDDWIDLEEMLEDFDAVVVIVRGLYANLTSIHERIRPPEGASLRRRRALRRIAPIIGLPRVHLVTYESMASPAERRELLVTLELGHATAEAVPFGDANVHRYAGVLVPGGWIVAWQGETPVLVPDPRFPRDQT